MASYNEKTDSLLKALSKLTETRRIEWIPVSRYLYLTKNLVLQRFLVENNKYIYSVGNHPVLYESESKAADINGGTVFLFAYHNSKKGDSTLRYVICGLQDSLNSELTLVNDESSFQSECQSLFKKIPELENEQKLAEFWNGIIKYADENQQ